MDKEMKDVETIHDEWKKLKQSGKPSFFAAEHLDMVIYQYYEQKEYIALLEKQVEDPSCTAFEDGDADAQ